MVRTTGPVNLPFPTLLEWCATPGADVKWRARRRSRRGAIDRRLPGDIEPCLAGPPGRGRLGSSDNTRIHPGNFDSLLGALKFL
ncbi:hypothetical protein MUG91_G34n20 [Manis pentadactyla]|nr:hypothetical protein MUG91_G34n20 [Manis pentadactyla]